LPKAYPLCLFFPFQTVQKGAWAELDVVEKRIRQQETDVERMKDEYHREVLHLRNLVKQKESIISRLQQEKTYVRNLIQLRMLPAFLSRPSET
jgi:TolA-binding protein